LGQGVSTIPTVGFNVETVTFKKVKFNVWDGTPVFDRSAAERDSVCIFSFSHRLFAAQSVVKTRFDRCGATTTPARKR
jgi:hypothetical protein